MSEFSERLRRLSQVHNSEEIMKILFTAADRIDELEEETYDQKTLLMNAKNYVAGDVWYWQGDSHDHPESLTCPIVISAEDFLEILQPKCKLGAEQAIGRGKRGPSRFDRAMENV